MTEGDVIAGTVSARFESPGSNFSKLEKPAGGQKSKKPGIFRYRASYCSLWSGRRDSNLQPTPAFMRVCERPTSFCPTVIPIEMLLWQASSANAS